MGATDIRLASPLTPTTRGVRGAKVTLEVLVAEDGEDNARMEAILGRMQQELNDLPGCLVVATVTEPQRLDTLTDIYATTRRT